MYGSSTCYNALALSVSIATWIPLVFAFAGHLLLDHAPLFGWALFGVSFMMPLAGLVLVLKRCLNVEQQN